MKGALAVFTFICTSIINLAFSLRVQPIFSDPCDLSTLPKPNTLRGDQITVLINGYSESRLDLLQSIASTYSSSSSVASVVILWGNPTTTAQTIMQLSRNVTSQSRGAPITVIRQSTDSLNARFLPRPGILTRAIVICDDDVEVDSQSLDLAFKSWSTHPDSIVGFFPRSHELDLSLKTWMYTVHPDKYSILLTKFMVLKVDYLYMYSCNTKKGAAKQREMRNVVDRMMNCEDILMNFIVADESGTGPVLVEAKRLRDHGDARNEEEGEDGLKEVGLSSRKGEHLKRRGGCIREFHKVLGRMPLRYSYGKIVKSVGEQGLCRKGGKIVFCDEQIVG